MAIVSLRGSAWVGSILAYKYLARVEVNKREKHSSLIHYGINYGRKMFYDTGQN